MAALRRTRLPYPLRHEAFSMHRQRFEAANHPTHRTEQTAYLRCRERAVRAVRRLAENARAWNELPREQKRSIEGEGVVYLDDVSTTLRRPTFRLQDDHSWLYPYDPQWDSLSLDSE